MSSFIQGQGRAGQASGRSAWQQCLLRWQQQRCDEAVADIFGYHSLQVGWPALQALRCNRMPRRWLAAQEVDLTCENGACQVPGALPTQAPVGAQLVCHPEALPFAEASLDLLVLPHTLERCQQLHAALREVARVLVPEGKVLIFGLNPWSVWGAQHALERPAGLNAARALSYWRLRDWLQLLQLEVLAADFGCHGAALDGPLWQQRWHWLDALGERAWPVLGGAYCVLAVKRVQGVRLLGPSWRYQTAPAQAATAPVRKHLGKKT